jgi:hypothetical protein
MLIEIDRKHLVLGVARTRKRQCRGNYICPLGSHASAIVDYQANRDWKILMAEVFDRLKNVIFVYLKICFIESGNKRIVVVHHCSVQDNQIRFYSKCEVGIEVIL